ncbi:MAG: cell division protein FtsX [Mangrovibacterium sp.]
MKRNKQSTFRVLRSYVTSTVSISLVLFLVGLMSLLISNTNRLSDYVQEHIGFTLILQDSVNDADVLRLQKKLSATPYVKESEYINKDQAAQKLSADLGEDFVQFLGFNPLFSSIELKIRPKYMTPEYLPVLEQVFLDYAEVKNVNYQQDLVEVIHDNVQKLGLFLLSFTLLLSIIFIVLINNTIRISMHNQRFTINTMKLVGATHSFIRKPFIHRSLLSGIIGALIAIVLILLLLLSYQDNLNIAFQINTIDSTVITIGVILIFGSLIATVSTYFSVNKYLHMKYEELF